MGERMFVYPFQGGESEHSFKDETIADDERAGTILVISKAD